MSSQEQFNHLSTDFESFAGVPQKKQWGGAVYLHINRTDSNGNTLLHRAILSDNTAFALRLIQHGADFNRPNHKGQTPLDLAYATKNIPLLAQMIASPAFGLKQIDKNGNTHLIKAVLLEPSLAKELIKRGAPVHHVNNIGMNAYMYALVLGNDEVAKLLANKGAYLETRSSAPFFFAIETQNETLFQWLLDMGVSLTGVDSNGQSVYECVQKMPDQRFLNLLHAHISQIPPASLRYAPEISKQDFDFTAVQKWIKQNLRTKLSMQKVCDQFGIEIGKLNGEFKRRTNMSAAQYIDIVRMEEVKRLVCDKNKPFATAIQQAGLKMEANEFINQFRKLYGVLLPQSAVSQEMFVDKKITAAIKRVTQWLEKHYQERYDYPKVVKISGLNKASFSKYFKIIMGMSPIHFINNIRLKVYRKILCDGSKSVLEAAQEVGFNSRQRIYEQMPRRFGEKGACKINDTLIQKMEEAKVWMQNNYTKPIRIEELAQKIGLSQKLFTVFFKQQADQTPFQYLQEIRLKAAHALIKDGIDPYEAAQQSGFSKLEDFRLSYKKMYNETPWRRYHLRPKAKEGVQRMVDYLRQHYKEPYDAQKMVEISNIPISRIAFRFKWAMGELPTEFHRRLRYEEVQRLVTEEGVSFKKACQVVGFTHNQYNKYRSIYGAIPLPGRGARE